MADSKANQQQEPIAVQQSRSQTPSVADAAATSKETRIDIPAEKNESEGAGFGYYTRIWSYAKPLDRGIHTIGFLAAIGAGAALPLMNLVFGRLINEFNGFPTDRAPTEEDAAKFKRILNKNTLWFVYLFIGKFVLVYLHTTCFTITATRITTRLRIAYIKSILRQEVAYFDVCTPGTVSSKISTNANLIQNGMAEKVGTAVQGLSMLVSAFAVAFSQQWKLTLVTATTLPAVVIVIGMTVAVDQKYETQILKTYSQAGSLAEEVLSSVRNVVAFGAHKKLRGQYEAHLDVAKSYGIKKAPVLGVQYSGEFSVAYCAYALALWYGAQLLLKGEIAGGGEIFIVLFSCLIATSSLTMIAPSVGEFTKAAAAAKDIFDMTDREPEIDSTGTGGDKPEVPVVGRIELKNVSFCYPARPTIKVLDDVNLVLEERKTTALVGASGSGKSTIVALAERWYDPAEGSIVLDGHELKDLNLKWLRSQIGLVSQEPVLFNDTVFNNVWYGASEAQKKSSTEELKRALVKEACIEANADSFIEDLPEGYDTNVGERAGLISGGQKQRIALARSIISNPAILLLDEATSALDPKSEALVQAALDKVARSRTTILIAHRLSTVKSADKIVVLSKGKIVEQGSHDELLRSEGAYYTLIKAQTLKASDQADEKVEDRISVEVEETDAGALYKAETQHSMWSNKSELKPETPDKRLSLLRCMYILFSEHSYLWLWYLFGVLCSIGGGGVFPAQAFIFSRGVTAFMYTGAKLKSEISFWALMFLVLAGATFFSYAGLGFVWTRLAFIMTRSYRSEYFAALTRQDIAFYDLPDNSSGALTSSLSSDPQSVHDMIQGNLGLLLIVFVNLTSSLTLSLIIGWKLALVAIFGALPIVFGAGLIRMRLELTALERTSKYFLESARFASEAVGSIRTVSSLTLEDEVLTRYSEKLRGPVKDAYKRVLKVMILFGLSDSADMLGMALTFWYGGRLLASGEYTQEQFFFIFTAIVFGGQAAGMLFGFTSNLTKCHSSANHIFHLRARVPAINGSTGDAIPEPDDDTPLIEFRDVRFSYPTRPTIPVLRTTNLSIPRGASVGLVGASGCGKTTIIALLERFYDVISGAILINGAPLTTLDVSAYRNKIALVAQEPVLYQGTIRRNILLGLADDTEHSAESLDALIEKAAKDANIHDFIMGLPEGYHTDVGSKGVALSGGQRQRLAIARALVRDPEILLLDEATSALDTESERVVQAAIEKASKGRTVVAVAHRLSTVRGCDKIVVLEAGRVVEEGNHEVLWQRKGVYWAMCQGQSLDRETQ